MLLVDEGKSMQEIATFFNTTRNAIIGLKSRHYYKFCANKPTEPSVEKKVLPVNKQTENKKPLSIDPEKQWVRKCLGCRKELILERPKWICDLCKTRDVYSS
tara:strand:+ start:626 stop:931 length:306 start_codon:yes stop_codon:yes gene_type:complete